MQFKQRSQLFQKQPRAFTIGAIEEINDEWVFFDDETDEAFLLEDLIDEEFEVSINEEWIPASLRNGNFLIQYPKKKKLQNGDILRIQRKLLYSFDTLLKNLSDESFYTLAYLLNTHHFSLYDCLYCHNFLSFQPENSPSDGVNFIVFDNGELVCSVYHQFRISSEEQNHRFELTKATGNRYLLTQLS
ncbi:MULTISPECIES: DUF2777 family protein [unclassified Bacillus (in: firmicutes)]|uniref:DUF2777 family protein n=1 Tax=unclassified Bacillus (in: firmicutes) TaxID=185979 RepID=UPI0015CF263D|nr:MULTISPECIES: DUF2777 family protein [unclassified Bacillus (in: firmicutes)]